MSRFVLLFGTSANPPTGREGHAGIVEGAARREDVDEVWVLPVYRHAFEQKREMPSFAHRMKMARMAFGSIPKVSVLDTEKRVVEESEDDLVGTIDVVRHLRQAHPDVRFGLLLGADTYQDLMAGRWKESEALRDEVELVAVPRLNDVSSTRCRETTDRTLLAGALQPEVLRYIEENQLYAFSRHKQS